MVEPRNAEITTTAVYNRLRELGDALRLPMRDEDAEVVVADTLKVLKAQEIVKQKLKELKLLK